jgi:hypothetical protein
MLCHACIQTPRGVAGHPSLRPDLFREIGEEQPLSVFGCDDCGAIWRRIDAASGQFEWTRLAEAGAIGAGA